MENASSSLDLIWLALALAAAGVVNGFFAGLLGAGGGAIVVPVLYQLFLMLGIDEAVRMHMAVGTSLGAMVATSTRSLHAHHARGAVDWTVLKRWVVWIFAGSATASLVAAMVSGFWLKVMFALIASTVAVKLLMGWTAWRVADDMPRGPLNWTYGFVTGLVCTLIGVGGAVFGTTIMTLHGRPIHQAVATSAGVSLLIAVAGATGFAIAGIGISGRPPFSLGYMSLIGVAIIASGSVLVAPLGVRAAHSFRTRTLEIAFGLFMGLVAVRFIVSFF